MQRSSSVHTFGRDDAGSESWVVRSLRRLVADLGALSSGEFVTVDLDALQFFLRLESFVS